MTTTSIADLLKSATGNGSEFLEHGTASCPEGVGEGLLAWAGVLAGFKIGDGDIVSLLASQVVEACEP